MYLNGKFQINPPLQAIYLAYLDRFHRIRHVKWDTTILEKLKDPLREAVGLPLGLEGVYYVAGEIYPRDDPTVLEFNYPPPGQPGLWCHWEPTGDGESLIWKDVDKAYDFNPWLKYLIEHFFNPWHYKLSGKINCHHYFNDIIRDEKNQEIEVSYVERAELIIKDDNIVIENNLGTFQVE